MVLCGLEAAVCGELCGDRPGLCGLTRLAWPAECDLAVVFLWDACDQAGMVWTNRRLVHGPLDALVYAWAINRAWRGVPADVLTADDLAALPSGLAPSTA